MTTNGHSSASGATPRILEGVKFLDLTWFGAGPIATRTIAGMGAEVIRVETEKRPDGLRVAQPRPVDAAGYNVSGYYNNFNTDKKSATIDLTTERGHELGMELVKWADIMMTNFTPRAIRQIGMDWETVKAANPGIIAMYQPMQGMTGPHTEYVGFGSILGTVCGINGLAGSEGNPPVGVGTNYTDYVVNPIHAVTALLAALYHKRRTGEGQMIDMSQLESSVAALAGPLFVQSNGGDNYLREGNHVKYAAPHGAYQVRDGVTANGEPRPDRWLAIGCIEESQWQRLAAAAGHPEWAADARFATLSARKANEAALDGLIADWAREQDGDAAQAALQAAGVPAGLVLNATEVLADEQMVAREYFRYIQHPEAGLRAQDGSGFKLSKTPCEPTVHAPLLGEHTYEVATEVLGLTPEEIGNLVAEAVLF
ncbi:MAG: CoA transferase [Chloroflexi bacterium]|nr:CoA transferase [Chloroflexota bacterium]MDA1145278.1 CoA transferase [Chloroflexota bacterium]